VRKLLCAREVGLHAIVAAAVVAVMVATAVAAVVVKLYLRKKTGLVPAFLY